MEFNEEIQSHELPGMLRGLSKHKSLTATESNVCDFAADEIDRLRSAIESVRHALKQGFSDKFMLIQVEKCVSKAVAGK